MKSGFVSIIGRPNVGKSTLLNNLLNKKVSIVSSKPATTRLKILGILTEERGQIIFVDTPGFEKPKNELGKFMLKTIFSSIDETDLILFLIEAKGWQEEDEEILNTLKKYNKKTILIINKVDLISEKTLLLPLIDESQKKFSFLEIIPVSALKDKNFTNLIDAIFSYLPDNLNYNNKSFNEAELFFPKEASTNLSQEYIFAEIIREKVLQKTYDEIPHTVAVEVEEIKPGGKNKEMVVIKANIILERENIKSILIGKDGNKIKEIGKEARQEIEILVGRKVYLDLWVKVIEDWRNRPDIFRKFGYGNI